MTPSGLDRVENLLLDGGDADLTEGADCNFLDGGDCDLLVDGLRGGDGEGDGEGDLLVDGLHGGDGEGDLLVHGLSGGDLLVHGLRGGGGDLPVVDDDCARAVLCIVPRWRRPPRRRQRRGSCSIVMRTTAR